jgi:hypothetical protein
MGCAQRHSDAKDELHQLRVGNRPGISTSVSVLFYKKPWNKM